MKGEIIYYKFEKVDYFKNWVTLFFQLKFYFYSQANKQKTYETELWKRLSKVEESPRKTSDYVNICKTTCEKSPYFVKYFF